MFTFDNVTDPDHKYNLTYPIKYAAVNKVLPLLNNHCLIDLISHFISTDENTISGHNIFL